MLDSGLEGSTGERKALLEEKSLCSPEEREGALAGQMGSQSLVSELPSLCWTWLLLSLLEVGILSGSHTHVLVVALATFLFP